MLALNQDAMALKSERARREAERTRRGDGDRGARGARARHRALVVARDAARCGRSRCSARRSSSSAAATSRCARRCAAAPRSRSSRPTFNAMADRIAEYRQSSLGEMLQAQLAAQATLDSLPDPVLVFAPTAQMLTANRAAEDAARRPARRARCGCEAARSAAARRRSRRCARTCSRARAPSSPRSFDEAVTVIARRGRARSSCRAASPVYEEGGGIVAATVVLQDVTRLRRFDELRDDLVSTVAHQFRTPLTSLRMAIHLCLEGVAGPLTEKQQDLLYAAREECERLQAHRRRAARPGAAAGGHASSSSRGADGRGARSMRTRAEALDGRGVEAAAGARDRRALAGRRGATSTRSASSSCSRT